MEGKLVANDRQHGRDGWLGAGGLHDHFFFQRLFTEVLELHEAVIAKKSVEDIIAEAADIANFAMMIADRHRDLAARPAP